MEKIIKKIISGMVLCTTIVYTMPILAFTNEETIYSKLDSNGEEYKTIITTTIEDENGTDVTQTESDKELPVDCEITYELNGEKIAPEELAGKSGKVKITLKYKNKSENLLKINGKEETLYTPFTVIAGTILDNDINKNVEVTNGKVINDGSKTIVVGIAMPGLQESLNLSEDDVKIPNSIEITMDSENFEMSNIISYCTPKLLDEEIDFSQIDKLFDVVDDLQKAINEIQDGSIELRDGVVTLNAGVQELNNGANELNKGIETLENGASSLNDGATTLKNGTAEYTEKSKEFNSAINQVSNGVSNLNSSYDQLDNGLNSLNSSSETLAQGAKSVSDGATAINTSLNTIDSKLLEVQTGIESLKTGENQLIQGIDQLIVAANEVSGGNTSGISDSVSQIITSLQDNQATITSLRQTNEILQSQIDVIEDENLKATLNGLIAANNSNILALEERNSTAINSLNLLSNTSSNGTDVTSLINGLNNLKSGVTSLEEGTNSLGSGIAAIKEGTNTMAEKSEELALGANNVYNGTEQVVAGTKTLAEGSTRVKSGLSVLDSSTTQLSSANDQLVEAAGTIAKGASDLASGSSELNSGIQKLAEGSGSLRNGTATLSDGTITLLDGTNKLVDGITQFNNDGIKKISNEVNGTLKNSIERIKKLEDLSLEYNKFGTDEERDGIKFITMLDSIKISAKEENNEEILELESKNNKNEEN